MTGTRRSLLYGVLLLLMLWAAFPGRWAWNEHRLAKAEEEKKAALARKARALYEEKCRTVAGEKIYRTVPDVEGSVLLKVRPEASGREWADLMWPGAAFALESSADRYVTTFLADEHAPGEGLTGKLRKITPENRGYINTDRRSEGLPGYRYVDVIDEKDAKRYRYTGRWEEPWQYDKSYLKGYIKFILDKAPAPDPSPRYGVTFEDQLIPEERALGVASSTVKIADLKTGEILGEMTRYAWGSTEPSGFNPSPWLTADRCPKSSADPHARTRQFVDQVLIPKRDK